MSTTVATPTSAPVHPLAPIVGGCYDGTGLQMSRSLTDNQIRAMRTEGTLLALPVEDGRYIYPVFQFVPGGDVHPNLIPIFKALRNVPVWELAAWLKTPSPALAGKTPADWLKTP